MLLPLGQKHISEPLSSLVFNDHSGHRQTWDPFGYGMQMKLHPPFDGPSHEFDPKIIIIHM